MKWFCSEFSVQDLETGERNSLKRVSRLRKRYLETLLSKIFLAVEPVFYCEYNALGVIALFYKYCLMDNTLMSIYPCLHLLFLQHYDENVNS